MDFSFTEEQETIAKLARDLFQRRATPDRLTELEAGDVRYDVALWKELAAVDLLGTALPESAGGNGGGFVELGVLLAEVGWSVAPVPAYATLVLGADPIARHGTPEQQQRFLPGVLAGGTRSVIDDYTLLTTEIGNAGAQAASNVTTQTSLYNQAMSAQQSVSGVNLDEEAASLVKYQQAYQASAQIISTAQSIFSSLLAAVQR